MVCIFQNNKKNLRAGTGPLLHHVAMGCSLGRCFAVKDGRDSLKLNYVLYHYSRDVIHAAQAPFKVCRLVAIGGFICGRVNKGVGGWRESFSNPVTAIASR